MILKKLFTFIRQMWGYWQLEAVTRLMPGGFRVGIFTYYQDKLVATIHITERGMAAITPVEWSEYDSWSHAMCCKTAHVDQVPDTLWLLIRDPDAFRHFATTCIRCNEAEGVMRERSYYCDKCEAERQEEHAVLRRRMGWDKTKEDERYELLLGERERTPMAAIAASFQIPWSRLHEVERDGYSVIINKENGHAFRVPFTELRYNRDVHMIHEIDENKQPVTTYILAAQDIEVAVRNNGEFVTEIEKPPYLY